MRGFINYQRDRFGFLVYSSKQDNVLDQDLFFLPSACGGYIFDPGQMVDFEIGAEKNRPVAIDIRPAEEVRLAGVVISIRGQSGIIMANDRFGDDQRIPFHVYDFVPDVLGRTCAAGMAVSFVVESKAGREFGVRVRHEDPSLADIDAANYWEVGRVTKVDGVKGYIERLTGFGSIPFFINRIESPELIQVDALVSYRVIAELNLFDGNSRRFWRRITATDVQLYIEDAQEYQPEPESIEAQFLAAPELPLRELDPEKLAPGEVYLPSEKRLSLREIIARRAQQSAA